MAADKFGLKGLVIEQPYVDLILSGHKIWDMRSSHTTTRGTIALIRKGSGTVVGLVDVVDSVGPLEEATIRASGERHRIPANLLDDPKVAKWKFAWVLKNPRVLASPVPYMHPRGAIIWVNLDEETSLQLLG